MYYCNVIDDEIITAPRPLPTDVPVEFALEFGWYPVVFLNLPHHVECNTVTQLIEMKMTFTGDAVECHHEAVNKTEDEVEQTRQLLLSMIRQDRDSKLLRSDWTQLPTAPLTTEQKNQWEIYRQALRDFPDVVDLENIVWPVVPTVS